MSFLNNVKDPHGPLVSFSKNVKASHGSLVFLEIM